MQLRAAIIGPAHGLRGEVILDVRTDDPGILTPGREFTVTDQLTDLLTIDSLRSYQNRIYVKFREVQSRDAAEALRGVELFIEEHTDDDAWYPHQLKGLSAVTPYGEPLGVVVDLNIGQAQDLLLVDNNGTTVMVPFVHAIVPHIDLNKGEVVIDPPSGLFDDEIDTGETN